eukprot:scaffold647884_cov41-Prasinocladus_malaysianus.AAC.1
MRPGDVASLAWSFAKSAGSSYPDAMDSLARGAATFANQLTPQQLAMVFWAYSSPEHASPEVIRRVMQPLLVGDRARRLISVYLFFHSSFIQFCCI